MSSTVPPASRRTDHAWERSLPFWHLLFFGLLAITFGWGLLEEHLGAPQLLVAVAVSAAMVAGYVFVFVLRRPWTHGLPIAVAYFVLMGVGWAILLRQSPTFLWLQPTLYSQILFVLPTRWTFPALFAAAAVIIQYDVSRHRGPIVDLVPDIAFTLVITAAIGLFGAWIGSIIEESEERHELIEQLEATRRELAEQERLAAIQAERQRMAREIHDTVAQDLTAIVMQLRAAAVAEDESERETYRAGAERIAAAGLDEARRIVWALRPTGLERAGLVEAIGRIVEDWRPHNDVHAQLTVTGAVRPLHAELEVTLLRTVQEGLANVARHAHARAVTVTLAYLDDSVSLDIHDDGVGFEATVATRADSGFGLVGMRERAEQLGGSIAVDSRPGQGTTVGIRLPVPAA